MNTLYLSIDLGASSTKCFYGTDAENYFPLVMPPDHIEIDRGLLAEFPPKTDPLNFTWVGIDQKYYALGYLAESFHAIPTRKPLKTKSAIQKICAAVWIAAQKLELGQKFKLEMNCVLPPGELGTVRDVGNFKDSLFLTLKMFQTPTGVMKVGLSKFDCLPEGGGMLLFHQRFFSDTESCSIGIFMLGYRNSSVFFSRRGQIQDHDSQDLGFSFLLDRIAAKTIYKTPDLLLPLAKFQETTEDRYLMPLLKNTGDRGKAELEELKNVISTTGRYYANLVITWMNEVLDSSIQRIIICGGTADYLKPDLDRHFIPKFGKTTHGRSEVFFQGHQSIPEKPYPDKMGNRMLDVYSLYQDLTKPAK